MEKVVTLLVGGARFNIACTADNLRELAIGTKNLINYATTIELNLRPQHIDTIIYGAYTMLNL